MNRLLPVGLVFASITTAIAAVAADAGNRPTLVLDTGGHTAIVRKVLFTPDGRELISVSKDKTIRVWDVGTGEAVRVLRPPIGMGGMACSMPPRWRPTAARWRSRGSAGQKSNVSRSI